MTDKCSLKNRKAIITGGSSGIGWEIARQLNRNETTTVILDVKNPPPEYHGHFLLIDFSKSFDHQSLHQSITEVLGIPDILILNAGRGIHEKLSEGHPDLWEKIFRINLFSCLKLIRVFIPDMLSLGIADIVFISSVSSKKPYIYGGIYSASKAALNIIAETLRLEVQPSVRVTTVHPGVANTRFFSNIIHGSQTIENIGWGAIDPEYIASVVLYALNQPSSITLNEIVIRPSAQPL